MANLGLSSALGACSKHDSRQTCGKPPKRQVQVRHLKLLLTPSNRKTVELHQARKVVDLGSETAILGHWCFVQVPILVPQPEITEEIEYVRQQKNTQKYAKNHKSKAILVSCYISCR